MSRPRYDVGHVVFSGELVVMGKVKKPSLFERLMLYDIGTDIIGIGNVPCDKVIG